MTDKGKVVIPKNLYYKDKFGSSHPFNGDRVNVGGFGSDPLFLRGDKIELSSGYKYFNSANVEVTEVSKIIDGYISKVHAKVPIELEVEDNMWVLKQIPLENRTFGSSDTLESIMQWMIDKVNGSDIVKKSNTQFTFSALTETTSGVLMVNNETAAQLLNRLHRQYGFFSYFRGTDLRCGSIRYVQNESRTEIFVMNGINGNVCAEGQELEYQRRDDIVMSAVAHNTITENTGTNCKDGTPKTRKKRLEVLVSLYNNKRTSKIIENGERVPENTEGERREFFFREAKSNQELIDRAFKELEQYYFDGLRGKFKTWAIPYMRHGDNTDLRNPLYAEQNGIYKICAVEYSGSVTEGLRQTIELDFKTNKS
jgi:hypothetical protein